MSKINDGGPAFPTQSFEYDGQNNVLPYSDNHGLSIRDWFAGQAGLEALEILNWYAGTDWRGDNLGSAAKRLAEMKLMIADAMIAQREKQSQCQN